jgi:hypothetical protein
LIVAEGFDAGHITKPELKFGSNTIDFFLRSVNGSGSFNLSNVITDIPQYDIIYVDWKNGTDYLQRNGLLLETIIRWVNNNKEPLPGGGFADNVVLGQSMGGVIGRWALRDMEIKGQQHHTRMFVSMDAPQQGANVPVAYQHLARHAKKLYLQTGITAGVIEVIQFFSNGLSPYRTVNLANRPAARQMLINFITDDGNIDNSIHDSWQNELRTMGYPSQNSIRNIAVSDGAECGTTQLFLPGAEILNINGKASTRFLGDILGTVAFPLAGALLGQPGFFLGILPGKNEIKYEFIANAQPATGVSQRIYRGKISFTKKILWVIPVTVTITERNNNSNTSLLPTDYYGGGEINTGVNVNDINFQNALVRFNLTFSHIPTFCFVPTPSALDIGFNNVALTNTDYLARYIGATPPAPPKNPAFVNFVTAFNGQKRNEQHISFSTRNGDWLAQELIQTTNPPNNPPIYNCSAFCENGLITGAGSVCTSQTYTAPLAPNTSYFWSVSNPNLVGPLNPVGNSLQLIRNGMASGTITLTVQIFGSCGITTLTRQVIIGNPDPPAGTTYVTSNYYYTSQTQITTPLFWFMPSGQTGYVTYYISDVNVTPQSWLTISGNPPTISADKRTLYFTINTGQTASYQMTAVGPCGMFTKNFGATVMQGGGFLIAPSPNPASENLKIRITDESPEIKALGRGERIVMSMYKFNNNILMKEWQFKNDKNEFSLNVSDLKSGQYILVVSKGKFKQSQQIVIGK